MIEVSLSEKLVEIGIYPHIDKREGKTKKELT